MTHDLELCQAYIEAHPADAGRTLARLPAEQATALLAAIPRESAARALGEIDAGAGAECLVRLGPDEAAGMLSLLPTVRAAVLLRQADQGPRAAIVERLPANEARMLATMLSYPSESAGALMDLRVIAVRETQTAGDAIALVRRWPEQARDRVYVVDEEYRLTGAVDMRELMLARPGDSLASITTRRPLSVSARAGRAAVIGHPVWRDGRALPVVDERGVLVGAISADVHHALEEDAHRRSRKPDAVTTVFALGELYWLGLSGVLEGLASAVRQAPVTGGRLTERR